MKPTIPSPPTEHAGTAHTSLRSRCALARFQSPMVTVRRGFAWVGIGFITAPTTPGSPLVRPPPPPVDPFGPGNLRTEPGRNPAGDDLHRPPDRPSRLPRPVDHRGRSPGGDGIGHPQIAFFRRHGQVPAPRGFAGDAHLSDRDGVSRDLHTPLT